MPAAGDYFDDRHEAAAEAEADLRREFPDVCRAADVDEAPSVRLMCGSCTRKLEDVTLRGRWDGSLLISAANESYKEGKRVARRSDPLADRESPTPCIQSGCPVLVRGGHGYCDEHRPPGYGGEDEIASAVKVTFDCPHCPARPSVTRATLLRHYLAALRLGVREIPLVEGPRSRGSNR